MHDEDKFKDLTYELLKTPKGIAELKHTTKETVELVEQQKTEQAKQRIKGESVDLDLEI